jgi:arginine decarboxylase
LRLADGFVYEAVIVGSLEDAFCAAVVNPSLNAAVLVEGFPYQSRYDAPALRSILKPFGVPENTKDLTLLLATALNRVRPELDIYMVSDRDVEALAGDHAADCVRRIFYGVEEFMEQHLAILEGVQARYETPFFDNLKKIRDAPDRHISRATNCPRKVDLQV